MKIYMVGLEAISKWNFSGEEEEKQRLLNEALVNRKRLLDSLNVEIAMKRGYEDQPLQLYLNPEFACNGQTVLDLMSDGQKVNIISTNRADDLQTTMARFQDIIERAEKSLSGVADANVIYNDKCEVHMPGQALSMYNETLLLEDSCTDALQEALDVGWRVIAACPQPDKRRPDYILGRFNPEFAPGDGAKRRA